jgi:transcriptional regulator with XRE-family HTH domain
MIIERPLVINQPQIGKLIRELRLGAGLTQEKFAVKLGVTYPTINRWENGHTKPSPLAMQKIEEMLKHTDLYGQHVRWAVRTQNPDVVGKIR